jgi:transcriptional regulator of arginine metabolism
MQKRARQQYIRDLIGKSTISGQLELVEMLKSAGFPVTQASVSRDLDELNIIKANGHYSLPVRRSLSNPLNSVELVASGDNLIIAKCRSGLASAVAVRIDEAGVENIAGTLAGDDTIFIAVADPRGQHLVMRRLWELFEDPNYDEELRIQDNESN